MGMKRLVSSVSKIRNSQNLLLYSLMAGMGIVIFALVAALMAGSSSISKPSPKSYKAPITSGASRLDPKEVYVERLTTDHELQGKRLDAMEKMLETLIKLNDQGRAPQRVEQNMGVSGYLQSGSEPRLQHTSMPPSSAPFDKVAGELRADLQGVLGDEENKSQDFITSSSGHSNQQGFPSKGMGALLKQDKAPRFRSKGIQRTSLMLINSKINKNLKTVDNTIPAGAFAGAIMVGGVDASTSIQASNDPRPVLLRVTDPGTLPRKFKSDLCGCHILAACYGDISSERVYMRLEKLTCTERKTGEVVEMSVNGYVAGEDGRAGFRGVVVDRAGESMRNAAIGGFLSGMGNFLSQSHSPITFSPANGLAQTNPMTSPDMLKFGAAKGASGALDKYADFYIKRAEQMQPVIQVQAGRKVDIVFTQGVAFENSAARGEMIKVNDQQRLSQLHNSSDTVQKPVEAWVPNQTPVQEYGK
jgi:conjugal transfer pilus assembly protein TraB